MSHRKPFACADCGVPIAGGKTGRCCRCSPKVASAPLIKYWWTPEWDSMLRDAYSRCPLGKPTVAIDRMQETTGYPRYIVRLRAQTLGIARTTRKPWRHVEIEFLRQNAGKLTPKQIARALHRSHSSVVSQMECHKLRAAVTRGYSVVQLATVLGISEHQVRKHLQRGWLVMDTAHRITSSSVRHLLLDHMDHLDMRLMDQRWLKEELRGAFAAVLDIARRAA